MVHSLVSTQIAEADYLRLALAESDALWEWFAGEMWEKPTDMALGHNRVIYRLDRSLIQQLDPANFEIRVNITRTGRPSASYFVPDLLVVPTALVDRLVREADTGVADDQLETYTQPLPLVVEVWSPSTGGYDARVKLREYQERGDAEIWYIHHRHQTVMALVRQADGAYLEKTYSPGDELRPVALPGVVIPVADLFA